MDDTAMANMVEAEEAWESLSKGFREAQAVLDQNHALIRQADDNHRSRLSDKLSDNVYIIQEISSNISKLLAIYSDMSHHFSATLHHHHGANTAEDDKRAGN